MKFLTELIESLSSENSSLSEALLKTKVLLHKIGYKELAEWVNNELNGYPHAAKENIPPYRVLPAQVLANLISIVYQINAHPIPLGHLMQEEKDHLQRKYIYQPLAVLEQYVSNPDGHLEVPIPLEFNSLLGKQLNSDFKIQRAWSQISNVDIIQIIIQVRSRLLDFMLELQEKLGTDVSEEEIKDKINSFDASKLFNNAIFGDNATIVLGNHNNQTVNNIKIKGDFNALAAEFRKYGVSEKDIKSLQVAIKSDETAPELNEKKFGPSVKNWLQSMWNKAVDTSWQIELGMAGSLLATALQTYYGWP